MRMPAHSPAPTRQPGHRLGRYQLAALVGQGARSEVWLAARLGELGVARRFALKLVASGDVDAVSRLRSEALLTRRWEHPNLRRSHELGSSAGTSFLALEWHDTSLLDLLASTPERRLAPETAAWIGFQCCRALATIHGPTSTPAVIGGSPEFEPTLGSVMPAIVHGDISPDNILLGTDGRIALADFGVAQSVSDARRGATTNEFRGKLEYAAPERFRSGGYDERADIYSLGCVIYQSLEGRPPFVADSDEATIYRILETPTPELRHASAPLSRVVHRALAKQPEQRFQGATEMASALARAMLPRLPAELEEQLADHVSQALGERLQQRERAFASLLVDECGPPSSRTASVVRRGEENNGIGTFVVPEPTADVGPASAESAVSAPLAAGAKTRRRLGASIALTFAVVGVSIYLSQNERPEQQRAAPTPAALLPGGRRVTPPERVDEERRAGLPRVELAASVSRSPAAPAASAKLTPPTGATSTAASRQRAPIPTPERAMAIEKAPAADAPPPPEVSVHKLPSDRPAPRPIDVTNPFQSGQ